MCTDGRMRVYCTQRQPSSYSLSPLSGPALLKCEEAEAVVQQCWCAVKTWTLASGANMWRRQIRGTPNWTPGPRIVDSGHVDIVIKHPRTLRGKWILCGMQILMRSVRVCISTSSDRVINPTWSGDLTTLTSCTQILIHNCFQHTNQCHSLINSINRLLTRQASIVLLDPHSTDDGGQ